MGDTTAAPRPTPGASYAEGDVRRQITLASKAIAGYRKSLLLPGRSGPPFPALAGTRRSLVRAAKFVLPARVRPQALPDDGFECSTELRAAVERRCEESHGRFE